MKKCPYCAEDIQDEAIKCKHCGEWLNQQTAKQTVSPVKSKSPDRQNFSDKIYFRWKQMSWGLKVLTVCLSSLFLAGLLGILGNMMSNNSNREVYQQQGIEQQAPQEQSRIKADQEMASFREEWEREQRKKRINDLVYGQDDYLYHRTSPRPSDNLITMSPSPLNNPLDDPLTRMEMENIAREEAKRAARRAVEEDRMIHGLP